jgi:hypothetical protein
MPKQCNDSPKMTVLNDVIFVAVSCSVYNETNIVGCATLAAPWPCRKSVT